MFIYLINYTKEYVVQRTNTMKKLSFFIMLLCAVTCYGEIVSEVSFNPSRMGDYNYLKVANKATLVGGLETDYLNIRSGDTVTLKNSTSTSATFKVVNQIIGEADTEISYPNAAFVVNDGNGMVYADGGKGEFVSGVITDRILGGEENGSNKKLKQKAGTLTGGSVTIEGGSGDLHDGTSINGFWLDGNLIPTPTSLKNKDCEMVWQTRRPANSSGTASDVKLLALANCKESSPGTGSGDDDEPESTKKQGGKYVLGASEYDTFTFHTLTANNPQAVYECSSYSKTSTMAKRAYDYLTGKDDLPQASEVCVKHCSGMAGVPDGNHTCSATVTAYWCSWFNGYNQLCSAGGSPIPGASTSMNSGYLCQHLTVRCYEE